VAERTNLARRVVSGVAVAVALVDRLGDLFAETVACPVPDVAAASLLGDEPGVEEAPEVVGC
jgi:hypothetical protein